MSRALPFRVKRDSAPPAIWPAFALTAVVGMLVVVPLRAKGFAVDWVGTFRGLVLEFLPTFGGVALVRMAIVRLGWGGRRPDRWGEWIRWGAEVLAGMAAIALLGTVYCWAKVLIPLFNPRNFDPLLARTDVVLHFGVDPVPAVQALFGGAKWFAAAIDGIYGKYVVIVLGAAAWLLASPKAEDRRRFLRGFVLVWLLGLALYWAVPALGPALVFADVAEGSKTLTPGAFETQRILLQNRQAVFRALSGEAIPIIPFYGIAALPSLHVAVPFFLFLFALERRSVLRTPFLLVVLLMSLGALLTGWHYAVDVWVGLAVGLVGWLGVHPPSSARSVESLSI